MKKTAHVGLSVTLLGFVAIAFIAASPENDRLNDRSGAQSAAPGAVADEWGETGAVANTAVVVRRQETAGRDAAVEAAIAPTALQSLGTAALANPAVAVSTPKPDTEREPLDPEAKIAIARAKMSGPVAALALAGGTQPVELVVRYDEHPELFDASRVEELGGEVLRTFKVLDMQSIRVPAAALDELALEQKVDRLSIDDPVSANLPYAATRRTLH